MSPLSISIIVAAAQNDAIGLDNALLYWLPDDMRRFRELTTGHTVVMGRKTFESLPNGPLPNRRNVVLTRQKNHIDGCDCFTSLGEALENCKEDAEIYIIGGASIYREAIKFADRLCLTEIDDVPEKADTFFPEIGDEWQETSREQHEADERHAFGYAFVDYERGGI